MNRGTVLSMRSASTPIKLITALQMIKPEGHTLVCVCACVRACVFVCVYAYLCVCVCGLFFNLFLIQQHTKEDEVFFFVCLFSFGDKYIDTWLWVYDSTKIFPFLVFCSGMQDIGFFADI